MKHAEYIWNNAYQNIPNNSERYRMIVRQVLNVFSCKRPSAVSLLLWCCDALILWHVRWLKGAVELPSLVKTFSATSSVPRVSLYSPSPPEKDIYQMVPVTKYIASHHCPSSLICHESHSFLFYSSCISRLETTSAYGNVKQTITQRGMSPTEKRMC